LNFVFVFFFDFCNPLHATTGIKQCMIGWFGWLVAWLDGCLVDLVGFLIGWLVA